ncbi:chondroitin proteoglycan-2-like [Clinocottus analis]|uniref:chondroitin proteoglycan-2-like n=1 Tax=Clinocottus analis TaxID=304258 RepID=UPI0035C01F25
MYKLTLTAGLCVIIASLGLPCLGSPPADFCNGKANGNHPNPTDTGSFISCSNGKPYKIQCPTSLVYSSSAGVCVHPDLPGSFCQGKADGNHPNPADKASFISCANGLSTIIQCPLGLKFSTSCYVCVRAAQTNPFCQGKSDGNYANPADTGSFISCVAGLTYIAPCQAGLVYDSVNDRCEYATYP